MGECIGVDMEQTTRHPETPPESPSTVHSQSEQSSRQAPVETEELLELLGDEYTYRVFQAVVEQPRTGRELIEAADVSKATVYRRLERLEEAGLVESTMRVATDGNHCKQFHAAVQSVEVTFGADGFTASVEPDGHSSARRSAHGRPADD
jgi:predicted transcriptional regulator